MNGMDAASNDRENEKNNNNVVDLLYGRRIAELEYMAEIYAKYGKQDKASEIRNLLARNDQNEHVVSMDEWLSQDDDWQKQA